MASAATICGLTVKLTGSGTLLADDTYTVVAGEVHRRIALVGSGHRRLPQRAAVESATRRT